MKQASFSRPPSRTADEFVGGAAVESAVRVNQESASAQRYPWEDMPDVKANVVVGLRVSEAEHEMLKYIPKHTTFSSMQSYLHAVVRAALEKTIAELKGRS